MLTQAEKDKWVSDLRSGNFKQGLGQLLTDNGRYCCLGVLAHEMIPNIDEFMRGFGSLDNGKLCEVGKKLSFDGLGSPEGDFDELGIAQLKIDYPNTGSLAKMNDSGFSFEQIAGILEKYLPVSDNSEESKK